MRAGPVQTRETCSCVRTFVNKFVYDMSACREWDVDRGRVAKCGARRRLGKHRASLGRMSQHV